MQLLGPEVLLVMVLLITIVAKLSRTAAAQRLYVTVQGLMH